MVTATVEGYLDAGIIPAVKHFPGLGTVTGDSHHALPEQGKSLAKLRRTDLVTFEAAIKAGAPVIMTGHVAVDAIEPGMPASISRGRRAGAAARHARLPRRRGHRLAGHGPDQRPVQLRRGRGPVAARRATTWCSTRRTPAGPGGRSSARSRPGRLPADRLAEAATRVLALRIVPAAHLLSAG